MAVAPAHPGSSGPTVYIVYLDDGTKIILNTGEIDYPDGRNGLLRGQPLLALRQLVECQGSPVAELVFQERRSIIDVRSTIRRLRDILGDTRKPYRYIVANGRLGYYLTRYRLEIFQLPPLVL